MCIVIKCDLLAIHIWVFQRQNLLAADPLKTKKQNSSKYGQIEDKAHLTFSAKEHQFSINKTISIHVNLTLVII